MSQNSEPRRGEQLEAAAGAEPQAPASPEVLGDIRGIVGRVIVELSAEGQIYMERYINGQRQRSLLDRGNEWWEILDALSDQRRRLQADLAAKAERLAKETRMRHNRVWTDAAKKFGSGFAATRIKGDVPPGYGRYMLPEAEAKAKPEPKVQPSLQSYLDLL